MPGIAIMVHGYSRQRHVALDILHEEECIRYVAYIMTT